MNKKNLYRLHRRLSSFIGIPIFLWAISGLMHPLMTSVRPNISTQASPNTKTQLSDTLLKKALPLKTVLEKAGIQQCYQVHLIHMDTSWYYQVLSSANSIARYFNLKNGLELVHGHQLYAGHLASYFLQGDSSTEQSSTAPVAHIASIKHLTDYTTQYSYVNRLLPVDKVKFDRSDQMAIYVDTNNSRFSFALDQNRSRFNRFFGWFHTWSWMDNLARLKAGIIAVILLLTLFTASLGIYLAYSTKAIKSRRPRSKPKPKENPLVKARRWHRLTAIAGAVFLLAWGFSGMIHALQNGRATFKIRPVCPEKIQTAALPAALAQNLAVLATDRNIAGLNLFQLEGHLWVTTVPYLRNPGTKDLMIDQGVGDAPTRSQYYAWDGTNAQFTPHSERQMAAIMARAAYGTITASQSQNAGQTDSLKLQYLTRFSEQYNFSDKILPVWQISNGPDIGNRIFLDVSTGSIVKKGDAFKQADALIFAFFHKHEFMGWAGKSVKDASTIIGVLILLTLLIIGYRLLYIKYRHRRRKEKTKAGRS